MHPRYCYSLTPKVFQNIAAAGVGRLDKEQPGGALPLFATRSVAEAAVLVAAMSGRGFVHAPMAQKEGK